MIMKSSAGMAIIGPTFDSPTTSTGNKTPKIFEMDSIRSFQSPSHVTASPHEARNKAMVLMTPSVPANGNASVKHTRKEP